LEKKEDGQGGHQTDLKNEISIRAKEERKVPP